MHRQPPRKNPELEALLDERDQLRIQISLAADEPNADQNQIDSMLRKLTQLEHEISQRWKNPSD